MLYRDRLHRWAIMRLLETQQWVVVGRFRTESDADGHCRFLRHQIPGVEFKVVFDIPED